MVFCQKTYLFNGLFGPTGYISIMFTSISVVFSKPVWGDVSLETSPPTPSPNLETSLRVTDLLDNNHSKRHVSLQRLRRDYVAKIVAFWNNGGVKIGIHPTKINKELEEENVDIQHSTWYRIYSLVMFILGGVFFVASKKNISNSLPPNFTQKKDRFVS